MKQPNIIIGVLLHDAGRQFHCYGAADAVTPNIDAMAAEGVQFTNHFSTGTVCLPSRAAILTGKLIRNAEVCRYDATGKTIPKMLKEAGFETWRCGGADEREYRVVTGYHYPHGGPEVSGIDLLGYDHSWTETSKAAGVTDTVIDILKQRSPSQRTYIAAAFGEAHSPYTLPVTDEDIDAVVLPQLLPQLPDDVRALKEMLARFNKAVTQADIAVGKLMQAIRELGLYDDTLVYFSCDHGVDLPRAKQTCYDSGTGVPLIFWGGALEQSGFAATGLSSHVDLLPTLCELLEITPPANLDGVSQLTQLTGKGKPREVCFSEVSVENTDAGVRAIRTERHKLILNFNVGLPVPVGNEFLHAIGLERMNEIYSTQLRPFEELYDLQADPCEITNLAEDAAYAEIKAKLKAELFRRLAATGDEILCACSPYENAYPDDAYSVWDYLPDGTFRCRFSG